MTSMPLAELYRALWLHNAAPVPRERRFVFTIGGADLQLPGRDGRRVLIYGDASCLVMDSETTGEVWPLEAALRKHGLISRESLTQLLLSPHTPVRAAALTLVHELDRG